MLIKLKQTSLHRLLVFLPRWQRFGRQMPKVAKFESIQMRRASEVNYKASKNNQDKRFVSVTAAVEWKTKAGEVTAKDASLLNTFDNKIRAVASLQTTSFNELLLLMKRTTITRSDPVAAAAAAAAPFAIFL